MGRLFGTDGIRGVANKDLSPLLAYNIGRASGYYFNKVSCSSRAKKRPYIVLGKDSRLSSDMLEGALVAGIYSSGVDVLITGVIPTPAVSFLTRTLSAQAGIMVSASHNPIEDNGIKVFDKSGAKLPSEEEDKIEALVDEGIERLPYPTGMEVGRAVHISDAVNRYIKFLLSTVPGKLSTLRIVLDCAWGATCAVAPVVFETLGADVIVINGKGDGSRINVGCGATDTAKLQRTVLRQKADLGFAFDGDGDRVIAVDNLGKQVNGDRLMVLLGLTWKNKRRLKNNLVVTTVMSSCGMEEVLKRYNIETVRTTVGDRYVYEEMKRRNAVIGGEQSGHILLLDYTPTGDAILTAIQVAAIVANKRSSLAELTSEMKDMPQILLNVPARQKELFIDDIGIRDVIRRCEKRLEGRGRLLVRPSGTEPLVRVMAEGPDEGELREVVNTVAKVIEGRLS